jgi:RNA polymerase sigma-54 factor
MSGMNIGLGMRQDQRMIQTLAPRMIQSMEILQLPIMALQERIEQELEENPVLELREPAPAERAEDGEAVAEPPAEAEFNPDGVLKHDETGDIEFARMDELNRDWDDHFDADHRPSRSMAEELSEKKLDAMQNIAAAPQSLQDHLTEQLAYLDLTDDQHDLAAFVISHLDENGYLLNHDPERRTPIPITFEEVARNYEQAFGRAVTLGEVEEALFVVHKLEPAGVGARDTKECLLLQVDEDTEHAELVRLLILHHLEDVAHNRLPVIQKKTGFDLEAIKEAIEGLRRLDPKPGAKFGADNTQYVTPDIVVERTDGGDFDIRLTDDWTPQPRISKRYKELAKDKSYDPKAREYLKRKIQSGQWLIDAIEQRRNTLIKVTREIINHQRAFLDKGPECIQPLKMEQIAEKVGVHVTTVSRAVDDKWVQTPRGVFPLKRFFGGGTKNKQTGEDVAWETIKQKLLEIIAAEDKCKPLSDEEIVEKFKEAGLTVARRTVTKYREALKIPSSRQRKEWAK